MSLAAPEPIRPDHDLTSFRSGRRTLDAWLVSRALKNERDGGSRTYVVCEKEAVVAYYCLSTGSVSHRAAPGYIRRNMPDPIPVMLMRRLAVARSHQGRGIARALVRDAILRTLNVAEIAGARALLVHALDDTAARFYRHMGFVDSPINPLVLMLPLTRARNLLGLPAHRGPRPRPGELLASAGNS